MAGAVRVTQHAIERFQERVANVSDDDARAFLSAPLVAKAVAFGVRYIRLGTGQRIVIENQTIVTVLPSHAKGRRLQWK